MKTVPFPCSPVPLPPSFKKMPEKRSLLVSQSPRESWLSVQPFPICPAFFLACNASRYVPAKRRANACRKQTVGILKAYVCNENAECGIRNPEPGKASVSR